MKSLKPRLLTAAIGIPFVVLVIFLSELWRPTVHLIVGAVTALMICEYLHANKLLKVVPLSVSCIAAAFLLTTLCTTPYVFLVLFAFMTAVFVSIIALHRTLSFSQLAYAGFGTLLISFGMSAMVLACSNPVSVTFFFFVVLMLPWMADAGGFFVGASMGRHKLCPEISPKKTVEGAIGGILFCMIAAGALGLIYQFWVMPDVSVNLFSLLIVGFFDAVLSIVGDLSFSLIKRHLGIKDYGSIFPGHGGFLDRFDSIIFTAPIVVAVGQFLPFLSLG